MRVRKPGLMISAGSDPNRCADRLSRSATVAMRESSVPDTTVRLRSAGGRVGELAQRAVRVIGPGRVMRQRDLVDMQRGETTDRRTGAAEVVAEQRAGVGQPATDDLQHVAGEEEALAFRVEADAARRVTRRVDDAQAAESRQLVAIVDRRARDGRPGQVLDQPATARATGLRATDGAPQR